MRNKYKLSALDADTALNALGRNPTDAFDVLIRSAYRTRPRSAADVVDLCEAYLKFEGDIDPVMLDVLESNRDAVRKVSH